VLSSANQTSYVIITYVHIYICILCILLVCHFIIVVYCFSFSFFYYALVLAIFYKWFIRITRSVRLHTYQESKVQVNKHILLSHTVMLSELPPTHKHQMRVCESVCVCSTYNRNHNLWFSQYDLKYKKKMATLDSSTVRVGAREYVCVREQGVTRRPMTWCLLFFRCLTGALAAVLPFSLLITKIWLFSKVIRLFTYYTNIKIKIKKCCIRCNLNK